MAERILIVEDESRIARFLELELKHEGYEVEIASDGRSGLERIKDGTSTLWSGPYATDDERDRGMQAGQEVLDIPIIMLTAKDDISIRLRDLTAAPTIM